jgi:hypothetical protein
MSDLDVLIEQVIKQIALDFENCDTTALEELLAFVPKENLKAFLPEGESK